MKAPVQATRRIPPQTKKRSQAYSTFVYRAHREVIPAGMRSPDFLVSRLRFPRPALLRLVGSEAFRLSKANRVKVITLREIDAAVTQIKYKISTKVAA